MTLIVRFFFFWSGINCQAEIENFVNMASRIKNNFKDETDDEPIFWR